MNQLTYGRWSAPAEVLGRHRPSAGRRRRRSALLDALTDEMVDGPGLRHAEIRDPAAGCWPQRHRPRRPTEPLPSRRTARRRRAALVRPAAAPGRAGAARGPGAPDRRRRAHRRAGRGAARRPGAAGDGPRTGTAPPAQRPARRSGSRAGRAGFQVDAVQNLLADGRPVEDRLHRLRTRPAARPSSRCGASSRDCARRRSTSSACSAPSPSSVASWRTPSGLSARRSTCPTPRPALPAAVEVAAYRVAQEALTNVVRHAPPTRCRVVGRVSDHQLVLEIGDDGAVARAGNGLGIGLRSMRDRADEIGGTRRDRVRRLAAPRSTAAPAAARRLRA